MDKIKNRILLIEDDIDLQEGLSFSLEAEGYQVDCAATKKEGEKFYRKNPYDLIVMDCNLPDGSGFTLCEEIRKQSGIPILMLTARDTEMDEVRALSLGVDDYMKKPFSLAVLKLRIRNLLKKTAPDEILQIGELILQKKTGKIYKGNREISLSTVEYRLLLYFMENPEQILSKEQILSHVWDYDGQFVDDNTVSVNIRRLRIKIEQKPSVPEYLKTVHGLGYIFVSP